MWNPRREQQEQEDDSWEVRAFAEDTRNIMGTTWPPRSYTCTFCRREFRSAQALGGHMNVHRRDRARLHHQASPNNNINNNPFPHEFVANAGFCLLYEFPSPNNNTAPLFSTALSHRTSFNINNNINAYAESHSSTLLSSPTSYPPNNTNFITTSPNSFDFPLPSSSSAAAAAGINGFSSCSFSSSKVEEEEPTTSSIHHEELDLELRLGNRSTPTS
ncbi:hypothetical protein VNO77_25103 [Canavalia gladiata]|uniref:C2H2-type domain-containing protein n=1 Tax=Canavalia gladiata TaxID=3824 RepID=A0AAN9L7H6_CANGL